MYTKGDFPLRFLPTFFCRLRQFPGTHSQYERMTHSLPGSTAHTNASSLKRFATSGQRSAGTQSALTAVSSGKSLEFRRMEMQVGPVLVLTLRYCSYDLRVHYGTKRTTRERPCTASDLARSRRLVKDDDRRRLSASATGGHTYKATSAPHSALVFRLYDGRTSDHSFGSRMIPRHSFTKMTMGMKSKIVLEGFAWLLQVFSYPLY